MTLHEAAQQALEALEDLADESEANGNSECWVAAKVGTVRAAFAQPESEPVSTIERNTLIQDLRLNHEFCPKEVILQAADMLEADAQCTRCKVVADDNNEHIQRAYRAEAMLAQQVAAPQKPVAWVGEISEATTLMLDKPNWPAIPLYAAPQHVPLSDAEIDSVLVTVTQNRPFGWREFGRAIEQAVRGKT